MSIELQKECYCGQNIAFENCCKPYHLGSLAATPEALMRSRYCAFATANVDYIMQTQAASLNQNIDPQVFKHELQQQKWIKLEVLQAQDDTVTFTASMLNHDILYTMTEQSQFERSEDRWIYTKALSHKSSEHKMSRNEPCPCGSGKKYKQCCQKG